MTATVQRLLTALGLVLTLVISTVSPAHAATIQTSNGFQISPVRSELTINKGQNQTVTVTVTNPTNVSSTVKAVVNDFVASSDESGDPRLLLNGGVADPNHNFQTLVASIPNVTIPAKGSKQINVTVTVPSDAHSGGYYGAIRFVPTSTGGGGNVGLTASVGTLFLITVPGNLIERLNLVQLSAAEGGTASSFMTSGAPQVLTRLDNTGDIHVQPFGTVNVKDMFGKVVATYQFNNTDPRANILPASIRKFVDPLPKKTWFGHYTIQESLAYQNGSGNLINATASFWYLPVWFIVVVIAVIVAIIVLIYWIIAKLRRPRTHRR